MCVVLVQNIGLRTTISNTTQICPLHFRNFMCVHWECAWCQCQTLVLEPPYPTLHKYAHSTSETLHKYAHSTSETSCVSTDNVHGASFKYWSQNHHIQLYTNMPTALQKLHVCPLGMCVVLVPNIGLRTTISNTTQICTQHFGNFMCIHGECEWCQCQILVLEPPYQTLHKYAHSTSETSCVSTGNVRGASAKFWSQNHHIQHYTNTPTVLQKLHVCPLTMCVVLVPNIGLRTTISNSTQICPQHFGNFMCVHGESEWCQCQILVLEPPYPTLHKYAHSTSETLHKYAHSTSETSCVSTGNVRGASAKHWSQNHHIQHYTNTPTVLQKLHVCPLTMCMVLVSNIRLRTTIFNSKQIYTHSTSEYSCVSTGNVRGASSKYWSQNHHIQLYTNMPTALQKLHVCPLTMCMVLVPNIGISTSVSNTTQIHPQHFRNFMRVHWECAQCQCQTLVLEPPYPTLHKYAHNTSETSCVSTGNVSGASAKFWSQNHHIKHYINTLTALQKLHVCPLGMCVVLVQNFGLRTTISNTTQIRPQYFRNFMCVHLQFVWCQNQILVLEPPYPTLHKYTHSTSETSCVSTDNVRGASSKYWSQNHHIQLYTNMPTALQKIHVCLLGM